MTIGHDYHDRATTKTIIPARRPGPESSSLGDIPQRLKARTPPGTGCLHTLALKTVKEICAQ